MENNGDGEPSGAPVNLLLELHPDDAFLRLSSGPIGKLLCASAAWDAIHGNTCLFDALPHRQQMLLTAIATGNAVLDTDGRVIDDDALRKLARPRHRQRGKPESGAASNKGRASYASLCGRRMPCFSAQLQCLEESLLLRQQLAGLLAAAQVDR